MHQNWITLKSCNHLRKIDLTQVIYFKSESWNQKKKKPRKNVTHYQNRKCSDCLQLEYERKEKKIEIKDQFSINSDRVNNSSFFQMNSKSETPSIQVNFK